MNPFRGLAHIIELFWDIFPGYKPEQPWTFGEWFFWVFGWLLAFAIFCGVVGIVNENCWEWDFTLDQWRWICTPRWSR
jgi:hypothetical protein